MSNAPLSSTTSVEFDLNRSVNFVVLKFLRLGIVLFLLFFFLSTAKAQAEKNTDTTSRKKVKILPVPAFGYSPETRTYVGAVSLFTIDRYQDSVTRTSNAKVEFNYTWNKQSILELQWNYFFKKEIWFTRSFIHFSRYPDSYFGIGPSRKEEGRLRFESKRAVIDMDFLYQIKPKVFVGPGILYSGYRNVASLDTFTYDELTNRTNTGFKVVLLADNRNSLLTPTSGHFIELQPTVNFSDGNTYLKNSLDMRGYKTFGKKMPVTAAVRSYSSMIVGNNPPFFKYPIVGGDKYVRGYFYGRYRDRFMSTFQAELRMPVFWRIGVTGFGGMSWVGDLESAVGNVNFKPNYGVGFRFLVDKNDPVNLRFDFAYGANGSSGFYVSFGESF